MTDNLTMSKVTADLDVSGHTANGTVLAERRRVLINGPARRRHHSWRRRVCGPCHTRHGNTYVTLIIDLTQVCEKTGLARLPNMPRADRRRPCSSSDSPNARTNGATGSSWLRWTGSRRFKTAAEELPDTAPSCGPFRVIRPIADTLDHCQQRIQQDTPSGVEVVPATHSTKPAATYTPTSPRSSRSAPAGQCSEPRR